jgi:hypothetical protein
MRLIAVCFLFTTILLTGCANTVETSMADAPEAQNLQEKTVDFGPAGTTSVKALDAQRDIPQILNQIRVENSVGH